MFGNNVFTLDGPGWERHRRITTTPFTERISKSVWKEALAQARDMPRSWSSKGEEGVNTVHTDAMTLAMHALTATGFGKSYDFDAGVPTFQEEREIYVLGSLKLICRNLTAAVIVANVPIWKMFLPSLWIEVKKAIAEYRKYMTEILQEERALGFGDGRENILSAFS